MKHLPTIITFMIMIMITTLTHHAQAQGRYASVNGLKMYYEVHGKGSPLVLIHGGGSTLRTTFGRILPVLAKTHQVIAVELQSHGHTPDRNTTESFEQDADDVAELLKQLNIAKADIFGFSNGGNTAMQIAVRHPERVRKLVIASSFYKRDGMYPGFWEGMMNASIDNMPQVYKDEYLKINPGNHEGLQRMFNNDAKRMQNFTDWKDEDLKSIQAQTLLVVGDQDVVRTEHTVEMYRLLPHARLAVLPGNHGDYMGEIMSADKDSKTPELFVAMMEKFLAEPITKKEEGGKK